MCPVKQWWANPVPILLLAIFFQNINFISITRYLINTLTMRKLISLRLSLAKTCLRFSRFLITLLFSTNVIYFCTAWPVAPRLQRSVFSSLGCRRRRPWRQGYGNQAGLGRLFFELLNLSFFFFSFYFGIFTRFKNWKVCKYIQQKVSHPPVSHTISIPDPGNHCR